MPDELNFLSQIDSDFVFFWKLGCKDPWLHFMWSAYGGTAISCRRNLLACIKPIKLNNSWVTAIDLSITMNGVQNKIIIASIYMPADVVIWMLLF